MKKAILAILVFFVIFVSAANAQLIGDYCSVNSVDIDNSIEEGILHTAMTYHFQCSGASGLQGQVTKMVITIPYTGIANAEASDNFGSLTMLEGPQYISAVEDDGETEIGVIFRKGLLITTEAQTYDLKIEFDSGMAVYTDSIGELSPGGLAVVPKVTIVTSGLTETAIPVTAYDFSLALPDGSSVEELAPAMCQFQGSQVTCSNLNADNMQELRVKWKKPQSLEDSVRQYANKLTGFFKGAFTKLKGLFK